MAEFISTGGVGGGHVVIQARDSKYGLVAVKIAKTNTQKALDDLVREDEISCDLHRRGCSGFVVKTYGVARFDAGIQPGLDESVRKLDGNPCLIMEWIDGINLAEHFRQHGKVAVEQVAVLAHNLMAVCAKVQRRGYLLRDPNFGNWMTCKDGRLVLIDLGMVCSKSNPDGRCFKNGVQPPEAMGENGWKWCEASDVYTIGQLVCALHFSKLQTPTSMPNTPFYNWLAGCIYRDPSERYRNCTVALEKLSSLLEPVSSRPGGSPKSASRENALTGRPIQVAVTGDANLLVRR